MYTNNDMNNPNNGQRHQAADPSARFRADMQGMQREVAIKEEQLRNTQIRLQQQEMAMTQLRDERYLDSLRMHEERTRMELMQIRISLQDRQITAMAHTLELAEHENHQLQVIAGFAPPPGLTHPDHERQHHHQQHWSNEHLTEESTTADEGPEEEETTNTLTPAQAQRRARRNRRWRARRAERRAQESLLFNSLITAPVFFANAMMRTDNNDGILETPVGIARNKLAIDVATQRLIQQMKQYYLFLNDLKRNCFSRGDFWTSKI